ncbi:MAG: PspC domain-containing protein [Cyclonatronaceae bacterium]
MLHSVDFNIISVFNSMASTRSSAPRSSPDTESERNFTSELEKEFNITHEDLERAFDDFVQQDASRPGPQKDKTGVKVASVIAGGVGVVMLVMMLQLLGLDIGPEISFTQHLAGPLVVLLSGLLLWSRKRSKQQREAQKEREQEDLMPDFKVRRPGRSASSNARKSSFSARTKQADDTYDAYAFQKKKRLFRTRKDRKILGVCGGIADYFGFDPTIVRIVFALSTFFYGTTLFVYLVLGIALPKMPEKE